MKCIQCKQHKQRYLVVDINGQFENLCFECYENNKTLHNHYKQLRLFDV